jgi:4-amino-4-deoxy-L-arabinose transferase-like glycosyltransferase
MLSNLAVFKDSFTKLNANVYNKILLGILVFHSAVFFVFQILDRSYQTWDSAGHIGMSYNIAERFKFLLSGDLSFVDFLRTSDYYPPFVQTIGAVVAMLFGYNSNLLLFVSLLFFLLAIVFLYIDIKLVTNSKRIAVFSAVVFSLFPEVYEQSRVFHLDLPLVSLLLIGFYFFLKSNCLHHTKYAIFFALFFSFAQLTKWYGFIYLAIPCLAIFYVYFKRQTIVWPTFIKNLLISLIIVSSIEVTPIY